MPQWLLRYTHAFCCVCTAGASPIACVASLEARLPRYVTRSSRFRRRPEGCGRGALALPHHEGWQGALARPPCGHVVRDGFDRLGDGLSGRGCECAVATALETSHDVGKDIVQQYAEQARLESEALSGVVGNPPLERGAPQEPERILEQSGERGRGVDLGKRAQQQRVSGAHQTIVKGEFRAVPVDPARPCRPCTRQRFELCGPPEEAVARGEAVTGTAARAQMQLGEVSGIERRGRAAAPRGIAARARAHELVRGAVPQGVEVVAIARGPGRGREALGGHYVGGKQRVLAGCARPGAGGEAEQPGVRARTGGKGGCRPSYDTRLGFEAVVDAQARERGVECARWRLDERAVPQRERGAFEEPLADGRRIGNAGA